MLDAVPKYVIPAQVSSVADTAQFTPKTVETASEREKLMYRIIVQFLMQAAPTTHFVLLAQAILFRGAGFAVVWSQFVALALIGAVLFVPSLARFRQDIGSEGMNQSWLHSRQRVQLRATVEAKRR